MFNRRILFFFPPLHSMSKISISVFSQRHMSSKTVFTLVTTSLIRTVKLGKLIAAPVQRGLSGTGGRMRLLQYFTSLIFLLNIKSAPFAWHFRICRLIITYQVQRLLVNLSLYLRYPLATHTRRNKFNDWFDSSISPVGLDPFKSTITYSTRATIDDCDFNGHLSNSSYGKAFDHARIKAAVTFFPNFFCVGGWLPLGATHYHFIREIPIFAKYEVRVTIVTWDSKWAFMVGRFITRRRSRPVYRSNPQKNQVCAQGPQATSIPCPLAKEEAPSNKDSALIRSVTTSASTQAKASNDPIEVLKLLAADGRDENHQDDITVHCIALSQVCFKIGRITIPPALVFSSDGMATPPLSTTDCGMFGRESRSNAPPHWDHVRKLRLDKEKFVKLMTGGWRDIPEGERWWEDAFRGEGEAKRLASLEALEVIKKGMNFVETL